MPNLAAVAESPKYVSGYLEKLKAQLVEEVLSALLGGKPGDYVSKYPVNYQALAELLVEQRLRTELLEAKVDADDERRADAVAGTCDNVEACLGHVQRRAGKLDGRIEKVRRAIERELNVVDVDHMSRSRKLALELVEMAKQIEGQNKVIAEIAGKLAELQRGAK